VTPLRQRMLEDLQIRRYSPTTIRIYLRAIAEFAQHFGKAPDRLGVEHIRQYQLFLIKEKKVSRSTFIQMVCALRFFYSHTLNRKISLERIPFPRRERKLPLILSREEVKALLEAPSDLRHRRKAKILMRRERRTLISLPAVGGNGSSDPSSPAAASTACCLCPDGGVPDDNAP